MYFQAKEVQRTGGDASRARGTTPTEGSLSLPVLGHHFNKPEDSDLFHLHGFPSITNSLRA